MPAPPFKKFYWSLKVRRYLRTNPTLSAAEKQCLIDTFQEIEQGTINMIPLPIPGRNRLYVVRKCNHRIYVSVSPSGDTASIIEVRLTSSSGSGNP